jgi:predicted DNA-binding protein (MmcQ/YjbR family)
VGAASKVELGGATSAMKNDLRKAAATLLEFALGFPEAHEDHPWGETVVKVNKKIFVFLGKGVESEDGLSFGVKLPNSGTEALELPYTEPAGYGMGKYGWVSVNFKPGERPPVDMFLRWIEESYRAVAPKKLVAQLEGPWLNREEAREKPPSPKRKKK